MLLLCDCCHSEYEGDDIEGGEQLCPQCFKEFIIDPQLKEAEKEALEILGEIEDESDDYGE